MSYTAGIFIGQPNVTSVASPIVGEVRYDGDKDTMQTWTGQEWVTLYGHKETIQETLKESVDRIALDVSIEHPNDPTVEDALKEWEKASEKFQVILALAEKK